MILVVSATRVVVNPFATRVVVNPFATRMSGNS